MVQGEPIEAKTSSLTRIPGIRLRRDGLVLRGFNPTIRSTKSVRFIGGSMKMSRSTSFAVTWLGLGDASVEEWDAYRTRRQARPRARRRLSPRLAAPARASARKVFYNSALVWR